MARIYFRGKMGAVGFLLIMLFAPGSIILPAMYVPRNPTLPTIIAAIIFAASPWIAFIFFRLGIALTFISLPSFMVLAEPSIDPLTAVTVIAPFFLLALLPLYSYYRYYKYSGILTDPVVYLRYRDVMEVYLK